MGSLVAVLLALLWWKDPWNTLGKESGKVALKEDAAVDRVVLVDAYDSTNLLLSGETWTLFGEESCNQTAVENLLIAARRLRITSEPDQEMREALAGEGGMTRSISFYRGKKEVFSFKLARQGGKHLVEPSGSSKAYYVEARGYPGLDLDRVFSSVSNHYREHMLIDLLPSDISRIHVRLPAAGEFHFHQDSAGNLALEQRTDTGLVRVQEFNELAIRLLFSYFTAVRYERKSGVAADSLVNASGALPPMATLQVASFDGEGHRMEVYPYVENRGEEAHLFKALVIYNQEPEALLINYIYLDVLMRDISHYLGEK